MNICFVLYILGI